MQKSELAFVQILALYCIHFNTDTYTIDWLVDNFLNSMYILEVCIFHFSHRLNFRDHLLEVTLDQQDTYIVSLGDVIDPDRPIDLFHDQIDFLSTFSIRIWSWNVTSCDESD